MCSDRAYYWVCVQSVVVFGVVVGGEHGEVYNERASLYDPARVGSIPKTM